MQFIVQSNFFIHSRPFFVDAMIIPAIPTRHRPRKIIVVLIFLFFIITAGSTAPEEFPVGEETCDGDHKECEDQTSDDSPER